jgi:hypothetical protein
MTVSPTTVPLELQQIDCSNPTDEYRTIAYVPLDLQQSEQYRYEPAPDVEPDRLHPPRPGHPRRSHANLHYDNADDEWQPDILRVGIVPLSLAIASGKTATFNNTITFADSGAQITGISGNSGTAQMQTGTTTTNHPAVFDANGNTPDLRGNHYFYSF